MNSLIQQRQTERFSLLYALYRKANGMPNQSFNLRDLAFAEGMGMRSFKACFDFLSQERLISPRIHEGYHQGFCHASITALGIMVVEEVFRDEMVDTSYFPSYREMMM